MPATSVTDDKHAWATSSRSCNSHHLRPANDGPSTLGGARIDFINAHATESESYALMKTNAAAALFAQTGMKIDGGTVFRVRAVAIRRSP
jgi:hypothetical protein